MGAFCRISLGGCGVGGPFWICVLRDGVLALSCFNASDGRYLCLGDPDQNAMFYARPCWAVYMVCWNWSIAVGTLVGGSVG